MLKYSEYFRRAPTHIEYVFRGSWEIIRAHRSNLYEGDESSAVNVPTASYVQRKSCQKFIAGQNLDRQQQLQCCDKILEFYKNDEVYRLKNLNFNLKVNFRVHSYFEMSSSDPHLHLKYIQYLSLNSSWIWRWFALVTAVERFRFPP